MWFLYFKFLLIIELSWENMFCYILCMGIIKISNVCNTLINNRLKNSKWYSNIKVVHTRRTGKMDIPKWKSEIKERTVHHSHFFEKQEVFFLPALPCCLQTSLLYCRLQAMVVLMRYCNREHPWRRQAAQVCFGLSKVQCNSGVLRNSFFAFEVYNRQHSAFASYLSSISVFRTSI